MAGLLDIFNSPEGRLGIGLLSMAGAQPRPMGFGERLAGAFQMQDAYKQQLADEESRKLRNEFQNVQMQGMRSRAAQEREAMDAAMRKQQALPSLFVGGEPALAPLMGDAESGILPSQGRPAKVGALDVQAALRAGYTPEEISKLDSLRNVGMDEVARTMTGMQGGREVSQQFDRFGRPVGAPMEQFRPAIMLNQGDKTVALDPISLTPKQSFQMGMSPESRASNALGWANNALARQRLVMDAQQNTGGAKLPPGYRWSADGQSMEAIPGGPADIKAGELGAKQEMKRQSAIEAAQGVRDTINEAKNLTGLTTAGVGGLASGVPMSDARALRGKLETIKANLGFDRLQQMRDQSPTGGALGSVAVQELNALQSTVASLDQMQSPAQLRSALDKIDRHYANWQATMEGRNPRDKGQSAGGRVNANVPTDIQNLLNKY